MSLFLKNSKTHTSIGNTLNNKIIGILLVIFIFSSNNATSKQYQWTNTFGNSDRDRALDVETDSNGDIYVLGHFLKTIDFDPETGVFNTAFRTAEVDNNYNGFLAKYSAHGDFKWVRTFNSTATVDAKEIVIDDNDNIYVSGMFQYELKIADNDKMLPDKSKAAFIAKFDINGDLLWNTFYESDRRISINSLKIDNENNLYAVGSFNGELLLQGTGNNVDKRSSTGLNDPYYVKFNPFGEYLNSYSFGSDENDVGYDVAFNSKNELFFAATFSDTIYIAMQTHAQPFSPRGERDAIIKKFDNAGNLDKFYIFGDEGFEDIKKILIDENDNIFAAGYFLGTSDFNPQSGTDIKTSSGGKDAFILKFNEDEYLWSVKIGGEIGNENIHSMKLNNQSLFTLGTFKGEVDFYPGPKQENIISNNNSSDIFIFEIGKNGKYKKTITYGGANYELGNGLAFNDDDMFVAGTFTDRADFDPGESNDYYESNGDDDIFIQKFSTITDVKDNNESMSFSLYPNPVSDQLNIRSNFENEYKIEIINMLGNTVYSESFDENTVNIDLSNINKGIYFVEISNDNNQFIEKLIVR